MPLPDGKEMKFFTVLRAFRQNIASLPQRARLVTMDSAMLTYSLSREWLAHLVIAPLSRKTRFAGVLREEGKPGLGVSFCPVGKTSENDRGLTRALGIQISAISC